MNRSLALWPVLLLLLGVAPLAAQEAPGDTTRAAPEVRPSEPIPVDTVAFGLSPADTVPHLAERFRQSEGAEALAAVPAEDVLVKNPRNAAIRAFLIPGWGQIYTGHPWRAVLFAAGEIGFFLAGYHWQQEAIDKRREIRIAREEFFADTTQQLPEDPDLREQRFRQSPDGAELFAELEFIRERREDFYAWAAASVIFAAVDAYVAAQLDPIDVGADAATRRLWAGVRIPLRR
jgi:Family of unknown function (DUF5683)